MRWAFYHTKGCRDVISTWATWYSLLGSKDLGFYVFRTLMCIVGKPWSKQYV